MPDWEDSDRDRDRRERDREHERWPEKGSGDRERGSDWERRRWTTDSQGSNREYNAGGQRGWSGGQGDWGTRREDESTRGPGRHYDRDYQMGRSGEDWRTSASSYGQGMGAQRYPRGSSGSEGGFNREQSYGSQQDLSRRGGGTGIRETERWGQGAGEQGNPENLERGQYRSDYGAGSRSFGDYGSSSGAWGGGISTYSQEQQQRYGRFTGRGPKSWTRSDDRIREDVCERLTQHPDIDATEIEITVVKAEVTLSGTVDERQAKRLAEDVAENIFGVKEVHNNIRVQKSGWFDRDRDNEKSRGSNQGSTESSTVA